MVGSPPAGAAGDGSRAAQRGTRPGPGLDVLADGDVPAFDRSNVDGYALRAEETYGATENATRSLRINAEEIATGIVPSAAVSPGTATVIATGGMLPRGADSVLMVEHARVDGDRLIVSRPVAPGANVSFTGTDMAQGELVLRGGTRLTARETGVLAAIGRGEVTVVRRPRVAILSTGDEIIAPGTPPRPAAVYDANATLLADTVRELGGEPMPLGIVGDDAQALEAALDRGLADADVVLMSGGTSKGAGDLSYRTLARRDPGIVVHGVALKPGKPICLGAVGTNPVVDSPRLPDLGHLHLSRVRRPRDPPAGRARSRVPPGTIAARMALRCNSERGRTEYLLVSLVEEVTGAGWTAYPMGKGSGSVTTFSRADGFVVIPGSRNIWKPASRYR